MLAIARRRDVPSEGVKIRRSFRATLAVIMASLTACSDGPQPATDAGEDAPPLADAGTDVGIDVGTDVGLDAGTDVGLDAGTDVGPVGDLAGDEGAAPDADDCSDGGLRVDGGGCLRCAPGERACGGRCSGASDPSTGCGAASCEPCAYPNAMATCVAGACAPGRCLDGFAECDLDARNGCEVSTRTDRDHCGACGNRCSLPNAAAGCSDGTCAVGTCNPGYGDCDGSATNGCETGVQGDLAHCGACGQRCAPAHATGRCSAGACGVAACEAGYADCDGSAANGCEVDVRVDAMSCGRCGARCAPAHATGSCSAGACSVVACDPGYGDCDGDAANGCEVDLRTSAAHCGTCAARCAWPNAAGQCRDGVCARGACDPGFADCDGDTANGCEVETASNPSSCGTCGRVCDRLNATAQCSAGVCRIGRCDAGSADCDGRDDNGCEVNTNLTLSSCGACGRVCAPAHATPVCEEGRCAVASCAPSYANCNGSPDDGCEVDTRSDVAHCGGCGNGCRFPRATTRGTSGQCRIATCEARYGDCNGDEGDGCETALSADPDNCGVCGVFCTEVCRASVCEPCSVASEGAACRGGSICRCVGALCACRD